MTYGPPFVGNHGDAFRRSSLCDLPPLAPAYPSPRIGRIQNIPPFRESKRLGSSVPRHLVGSENFHQVFSQSFYVGLCMVRYILLRKHLGTISSICLHPRQHFLGMESAATRTPLTPDNIPAAETCATSTRFTLRRSAPPSPPPSFEQKPALSTGAMAHAIEIQQRLSRHRGRRPRRRDPIGRSPQGVAL